LLFAIELSATEGLTFVDGVADGLVDLQAVAKISATATAKGNMYNCLFFMSL
jgi:hypothetical protein